MTPGCACRYSLLRILVVFTVEYVDGHLLILFRLELNFVKMLLKFLLEKCTKSYFSAYRQTRQSAAEPEYREGCPADVCYKLSKILLVSLDNAVSTKRDSRNQEV